MIAAATAWTDLGDGVAVRQSRAYRMNSVRLAAGGEAVLVDPGVLPSELDDLAAGTRSARAVTLILTHAHWDHVLGRPWWPQARTVAHAACAAAMRRDAAAIAAEAAALATRHGESFAGREYRPFEPDLAVAGEQAHVLGGQRLVFRDAFGHCDHQLSIHLPERRLLLAADMLSDIEIPFLDRPPAVQAATLRGLVPLLERGEIHTLVPGHGAIARGAGAIRARFERDLDYLERLEREVRAARARGLTAAETADAVGPWAGVERDPEFPMARFHRENVELTHRGLPG